MQEHISALEMIEIHILAVLDVGLHLRGEGGDRAPVERGRRRGGGEERPLSEAAGCTRMEPPCEVEGRGGAIGAGVERETTCGGVVVRGAATS